MGKYFIRNAFKQAHRDTSHMYPGDLTTSGAADFTPPRSYCCWPILSYRSRFSGMDMQRGPPRPLPSSEPLISCTVIPWSRSARFEAVLPS